MVDRIRKPLSPWRTRRHRPLTEPDSLELPTRNSDELPLVPSKMNNV